MELIHRESYRTTDTLDRVDVETWVGRPLESQILYKAWVNGEYIGEFVDYTHIADIVAKQIKETK